MYILGIVDKFTIDILTIDKLMSIFPVSMF